MDPIINTQELIQKRLDKLFLEEKYASMLDFMYNDSVTSGYINEENQKKNIILPPYVSEKYGGLNFEVTINAGKPEVLASLLPSAAPAASTEGPKCSICWEHVGVKAGLIAYECEVNGDSMFFQLPPYPYFLHHCIAVNKSHIPQVITTQTIQDLVTLAEKFGGLKIASNTDKDGTGCTNLAHRHFQCGGHDYAVFNAKPRLTYKAENGAEVQVLLYPAAAVKVIHSDPAQLVAVASQLQQAWQTGEFGGRYRAEWQTQSTIAWHNQKTGDYEIIIFPRNADKSRFLTRELLQCLKKEFVGIFEMCGYAILPGRLGRQIPQIATLLSPLDHNLPYQLTGEYEIFNGWLNQYVRPNVAKGMEIPKALDLGLQEAFLGIISDASPFKAEEDDMFTQWFESAQILPKNEKQVK